MVADERPDAWQSDVASLRDVWHVVEARRHATPPGWETSLNRLQQLEQALRARGAWARGPHDLMGILWLAGDEVRLCRVLAWLLDPEGSHGLGASFISSLLHDWDAEFAGRDLDPQDVRVVSEDRRAGTRADLVLYGRGWTVVVEAKVSAPEQPDQGRRLEANWSEDEPTFVFLTKSGNRLPATSRADVWVPYSWAMIGRRLREALLGAKAGRGRPAAAEFSRTLEAYYT